MPEKAFSFWIDGVFIDPSKDIGMLLVSPLANMREGEQYVIFINKLSENIKLYRLSTVLYSVVPLKKEIKICVVKEEEAAGLKLDEEYDYVARYRHNDEQGGSYAELANSYIERYAEICEMVLRKYLEDIRITVDE